MAARIEGVGTVQVTFDRQGEVSNAELAKTTGSIILDRETLKFVREHWKSTGGQRTTRNIEVEYRMPPPPPTKTGQVHVQTGTNLAGWHTPRPAYPGEARFGHTSGSVTLEITSDVTGRISRTKILRSSGSDLLDGYTADFVRLTWRGPPGKTTVRFTTFEYRLY